MNFNKKRFTLGIAVILIILLVIISYTAIKTSKFKNELATKTETISNLKKDMEFLKKKSLADELFISGKYDSAQLIYKSLTYFLDEDSLWSIRKSRIKEFRQLKFAIDSLISFDSQKLTQAELMKNIELQLLKTGLEDSTNSIVAAQEADKKALEKELLTIKNSFETSPKLKEFSFYSLSGTEITYFGQTQNEMANG
ncbi:hypothetical protein C9994_14750, partial [Marivirga lumbricoides]